VKIASRSYRIVNGAEWPELPTNQRLPLYTASGTSRWVRRGSSGRPGSGRHTGGRVPAIERGEFPRNGRSECPPVFNDCVVAARVVHHPAALAPVEVAALVVLQQADGGVDVVVLARGGFDEAPAVVVVHADARARVDDRLH